ncbi:uncharacterized protein [Cardiocondyla obscurior]|uniref:uncharacterized protein isoform X2 n=1 Tax=Cardiocondyla obscurior TaxID=286306 RepID=UPI003965820C
MLSPTPSIDRSNLRPGTGYLIAPRVPHGLATVVEGLAREVLRHRPEDIYIFAARHFEKLLKLREEYHAEEYSDREFDHEFSRDFNLWPTKETRKASDAGWSLEKEIEIFERHEQMPVDVEESQEDVSTDRENWKASKQTCSKTRATTKKVAKKSKENGVTSDARATRIISQMTALPGKNIQTKDIKQELRKNKLSGEKSKATDSIEKGIRGDRRSRTKVLKKDSKEETERATTTTSSSRTSARRPLKKVRRIETESETETEREVAKTELKNGYSRSCVRNDGANHEAITRTGSTERRSETRLSEHSFERKVSSRALSMDRIRAYVLRKFASTASLEVLRSPTYVEQVQEVIDRAAPIIKEKLKEIGLPREKRSRSVDLSWNGESFYRYVQKEKKHGDKGENRRGKSGNELERKIDITEQKEVDSFLRKCENVEKEEKKLRRRSAGSGKKSRRCENGDLDVADQIDDNSKSSNKLEYESDATRDTLEARLTATQSILEGISKSTELGSAGKSELPAESDQLESEISDYPNVVSLPVVRPPSSRTSRSSTKNGSDNITLPPISPEAPKSTKKKDELSLPVLSTASNNGNHSTKKPQDVSKDAEEASTMHDITSDIEDIAVLPENEDAIIDAAQDSGSDRQDLTLDAKIINEEEHIKNKNADGVFREDAMKRGSLEEFEELEELEEGRRSEEVFRDSLNVTPDVANVSDSLVRDRDEVQLQDGNMMQENTFDRLKDKLIEIEMAERNIEKALGCQQVGTCDVGEITSQAEKSVIDGKINEAREPTNEEEETISEIRKSTDARKIPINKDDEVRKNSHDKKKKSIDNIEETKDAIEIFDKTENSNKEEKLINKIEKVKNEKKELIDKTDFSHIKLETSTNKIKKSENEAEELKAKVSASKNGIKKVINQTETITSTAEKMIKTQDERLMNKTEKSINEKLSNGVEELAIKVHVDNVQSINSKSQSKKCQDTETVETNDDATTSKQETKNKIDESSKNASENTATNTEYSITNHPDESDKTKARKKREGDKLPLTTPLSLEVPYSYVLSEGSPCEIPDSVTTVIIPDRSCSSPVFLEDRDIQLESINQREKLLTHFDTTKEISKDEKQEKDRHGYGMEMFGEYVKLEAAADTDLMRGVKGMKTNQEIIIVHQDLDRIKEEGEEEEEKEYSEQKKTEVCQENTEVEIVKEEEINKAAILEDIVEHEEIEETDVKTTGSKDFKIHSSDVFGDESLSDIKNLTLDTASINEEKADVAVQFKSALENSSEESGSTQDTHTTTSSDVKESTVSNRSIESPSLDRPVVPELNLDSLQDNTVSSFKLTANGTEKEDNGSLRESDATISLIEPLTSDERMVNQLALVEHEKEIATIESMERELHLETSEAEQLYHEEHVEYEWLEKDPLSTEINLEDEANNINIKVSNDAVQIDSLLQEKEETEELGSEEEIARELIDSLDKDMHLCADKSDVKKDNDKSEKSGLNVDDKSNEHLLASTQSMLVEREKSDHKDSLHKINNVIKIETNSELSGNILDVSQDKKSAIINKVTEKNELEVTEKAHIENSQVAPLAQLEQDDLLEENKLETIDERKIAQNKSDINADHFNVDEKQEKQEKSDQVKVKTHEECENELKTHEESEQKKLDIQDEVEQEKLKIQDKSDEENVEIKKEITNVSSNVKESKRDSMNESITINEHEKTKSNNESIIDNQMETNVKNEKEEKIKNFSKIASVHGPITSAISEQSMENRSHLQYWATERKSSTVETVIEASDSNTSTDEQMKIIADTPEIITDESLTRKKDDFHSAVVKIQACVRGFLTRRHVRGNMKLEVDSSNDPLTQNTVTN